MSSDCGDEGKGEDEDGGAEFGVEVFMVLALGLPSFSVLVASVLSFGVAVLRVVTGRVSTVSVSMVSILNPPVASFLRHLRRAA